MSRCWPVVVAVLVAAGAGCAVVRGSGNVVTEQRQVSGFNCIDLSGSGKLIIAQGSSEGLTIEAEDNIIGRIETSVISSGCLTLAI